MRSPPVTTKRQRLAEQATRDSARVCTNLAHLIDEDFLREAYGHTRKSSAAGSDGVTAERYAEYLDENRHDLHEHLRKGCYPAAPVVRGWIEQEDGGSRPIGKPAFEDKMVQRAVAMWLEAMYAQDFSESSYGFRPGRSPHHAWGDLRAQCMTRGIGWLVEAEVSGYFDHSDRTRLREGLRLRVNDGGIMRLLGKWLRAGVREDGRLSHLDTGVVQGGVRSPVLANIGRHHVLDAWCKRDVQPRLKGRSCLTRFADGTPVQACNR